MVSSFCCETSRVPRTRLQLIEQESGAGRAFTEVDVAYTLSTCMRLDTATCTARAVCAHLGSSVELVGGAADRLTAWLQNSRHDVVMFTQQGT